MSKIHTALLAVQNDILAIDKERKSTQGYNFRGIDDVMNEVHPHFTKHGIFVTTKVLENLREERPSKNGGVLISSVMKVNFTFHADDGSTVDCEMIGEGMDSGDKSSPKAQSIAFKYAILQMFTIPTVDPKDPENDNPEPLPKIQPLPGMKGSKSYDDWRQCPWHLPFGDSKAMNRPLKGLTLGEIEKGDLNSLSYWARTYKPIGKAPEDKNLRLMLDKAREELAKDEEVPVEDPPQVDAAIPDKEKLLAEIQELCSKNKVQPDLIVAMAKKKKVCHENAKFLADLPIEIIQKAIEKFDSFVAAQRKEDAK